MGLFQQSRNEGRQEGIQYGEATTLLRQMEKKFGKPPTPEYRSRIESADSELIANLLIQQSHHSLQCCRNNFLVTG